MNLNYQDQHEMKNLNYQMSHILYQILKIIFSALSRNMKRLLLIQQMKSTSTKLKVNLHLKSNQDTTFKF